jgi:SAM-dependent methyltransferase
MSVFEKHVKRIAKDRKDPRILVLGASPEIRNMTGRKNMWTTVLANDLEVIERMAKLMETKNSREEWLEGDILKLGLKQNSFDVIFSDNVISNISPYNTDRFYARIRHLLKKDGSAVMRFVVFAKTRKAFENRIKKHFRIVDKEFGKEGVFAEHFPIYHMVPKRKA